MSIQQLVSVALQTGLILIVTAGGLDIRHTGRANKNLVDMIRLHELDVLAFLKAQKAVSKPYNKMTPQIGENL